MARVIYGTHNAGGKEYVWRVPENVQVCKQDWAVVRTRHGIKIVQIQRVEKMDDAEAEKLESVVQAVRNYTAVREAVQGIPTPPAKKKARKPRKDNRKIKRATAAVEKTKRRWAESQFDLTPYWDKGFSTLQLEEIRKGLLIGLDVKKYAIPELLPGQMKKKRWALIRPLATYMGYLPDGLSKEQQREILLGIESRIDVTVYADVSIHWKKMRLLRQCMEVGMDGKKLRDKTRKEIYAILQATKPEPSSGSTERDEKAESSSGSEKKPLRRRGEARAIIQAYQAAHPQATRNEAARETGYTWATVNKFWVKEEEVC